MDFESSMSTEASSSLPTFYSTLTSTSDFNNNNLNLKEQALLNKFVSIAGCSFEQAYILLSSANWQYQV